MGRQTLIGRRARAQHARRRDDVAAAAIRLRNMQLLADDLEFSLCKSRSQQDNISGSYVLGVSQPDETSLLVHFISRCS